jgi:hypothetical protein
MLKRALALSWQFHLALREVPAVAVLAVFTHSNTFFS